ncbi:uncharacterized protein LOC115889596 [Sitophilus oryzae]|uniref:Uncharacterized protein LOC115889596 n=1 Tax=Sitophilus oryzae TaxID=7048 RepID=A0A6J2YQ93_SITOR|nr:uncharacterized protein LOC115889596 [Sitophilus oryzae]
MDRSMCTILVLLDQSKAFDLVNFELMLAKLNFIGFDGAALAWFKDYLYGRCQRVTMVRTYKHRTDRRSWSEDVLIAALHSILHDHKSVNAASIEHGIPEATLRRYIKKQNNNEPIPLSGGRFRRTFSDAQEAQFVTYLTDLSIRAFGITSVQFRKLAYEFAELNNINHQFCKTTKLAGTDWLKSFMSRHRISLRTPESTSLGRLFGFNKVEVTRFFELLRETRLKYNFTADRIYNADESGLSTVPNKKPKILSPTGSRRVSKVASGERGKNTTVVCAMNAQGSYVPPFFIFGRVRMRPDLLNGCPPNSAGIAQPSGWMNTEAFVLYLKHFVKFVRPNTETPVLLIVDNHSSHTSLEAINYCRDNGVVMLGLPPHSTHRLQPLDVGFFGPLKTFYSQTCDNYLVNHPGKQITDKEVGRLFGQAYLRAATVGTAIKSFSACGIEPFNAEIFGDSDFAPSMVSERHVTADNEFLSSDDEPLAVPGSSGSNRIDQAKTKNNEIQDGKPPAVFNKTEPEKLVNLILPGPSGLNKMDSAKNKNYETPDVEPPLLSKKNQPARSMNLSLPGPSGLQQKKSAKNNEAQALGTMSSSSSSQTISNVDSRVTLLEMRPFPKYTRPIKTTKRIKQRASVITSTPNKEEQERKNNEKNLKEIKRRKVDSVKVKRNVFQENREKQVGKKKKTNDIFCPGCQESYIEPPTEDWIQCNTCESWWHESCTAYEKDGTYTCDICL